MCYDIYNERRKDTTTEASQRLQREPTNNGSVSQKGGKHSTTKIGFTAQKPPGQCSP